MACCSRVRKTVLNLIDEFLTECSTDVPYFLIRNLVDTLEARLVIVVSLECLSEYLGVNSLPLWCSPCRIVNAICNVAYVKLLWKVCWPHVTEDIAAYFTVEP